MTSDKGRFAVVGTRFSKGDVLFEEAFREFGSADEYAVRELGR